MTPDQVDPDLPVGTVTFLFTDFSDAASDRLAPPTSHDDLIAAALEARQGVCLAGHRDGAEKDGTVAVFASAANAVGAALDVQQALVAAPGPEGVGPGVRIGVHTGEARLTANRTYQSAALRRGARLRDVAHGGQTLLSSVTASIVTDALPAGVWLDDLGMHRLRDLTQPERIFELRHADLGAEFPPLRSLDVLANNLPTQLTSFVGRERELAVVQALLAQERLLTLTGSGGCGKTRLAVQSAAGLADRWPDGVWWVGLGPVTDPGRVAEVAAASLRILVEPVGGPTRALTLHLRDRDLLLCLDNCEHVLDSSAELAETLLRTCPEVSVLATSREPLGVAGETVWRVPSMPEDEAVTLFGERASRVNPGFTVDHHNDRAVSTICHRLDGIPLAIELAAAWVRTLTPAQIATALDDRFRLLTGGTRDVVARQRTLEASVQWSHDLLDELDRAVFRRLAVFAGGFSIEAARAVCAGLVVDEEDVLGAIRRLVDKSLVIAEHPTDETRYQLLETIHHYAHDQLHGAGETVATRDRHLGWFLTLAETAEPELELAAQDIWLARLETEHDNLRAALDWGLSASNPDRGRRLAAALPRLWLLHGHAPEGIEYLQRAIGLAEEDRTTLQTRLLVGASLVGATGGQFELTLGAAQRGLDLARANDDDRNIGRSLALLAYIHVYLDFGTAQELCAQARHHADAADDAFAFDLSLVLEGLALMNGDRHEAANPILAAAAERCRRRNDRILAAFALTGQMEAALRTGDVTRAERLGTEAMQLAEPLGDYFTVGITTSNLAWVKGVAGDIEGGLRLLEKVVRSVESAGHAVDVPTMAVTAGQLHLWDGDVETARAWFERAGRYAEPFVDNLIVARVLPGLAAVHRRLGDLDGAHGQIERALALARKLGIPHVVAEALDENGRLVAGEDPDRAEDLHHEALSIRLDCGLRTFYVDSLDALARIAYCAEDDAHAARLYAASDRARGQIGYPCPSIDRPDQASVIAGLRSRLGDDAFEAAWSEGSALCVDDAVAYVRRARGLRGRPSSGWASLTPTERKVVDHVVEGLTNDEIGGRLFVSRNTVKTHLAHIYTKLAVANRTELAVFATSRIPRNT